MLTETKNESSVVQPFDEQSEEVLSDSDANKVVRVLEVENVNTDDRIGARTCTTGGL